MAQDTSEKKSVQKASEARIQGILSELAKVMEGQPVGRLRNIVATNVPGDPEARREYLKELELLKYAAEAAYSSALEVLR